MILAADISGSLDAKNIVMDVLEKGEELSNLLSVIKTIVQVPKLNGTIPVMTAGAVHTDVLELEETDVEGADFDNIDFSLKKDRVKLAVSDEAGYRSMSGDPLEIQKRGAGRKLANALDTKIITALETTPQTTATAGAWSTSTNNPMADLGLAIATIQQYGYTPDFVIMPPAVYAKYAANDYVKNAGQGNPVALKGAMATVPGTNLNIFTNSGMTAKSVLVGASDGVPGVLGQGPVKVRTWDSPHNGATVYQMDVFRQVKAPIFLNASSLNLSVYQVTSVIS